MVIFKILHQYSLAGSSSWDYILDLDWHIMAAGSQISLCYPTVTCCCGLPRDYSDCSVLYISLCFMFCGRLYM